jgi:hypothetical protein
MRHATLGKVRLSFSGWPALLLTSSLAEPSQSLAFLVLALTCFPSSGTFRSDRRRRGRRSQ